MSLLSWGPGGCGAVGWWVVGRVVDGVRVATKGKKRTNKAKAEMPAASSVVSRST